MLINLNLLASAEYIEVSNKTAYKLGLLVEYIRLYKNDDYVSTLVTLKSTRRRNDNRHISHIMQDWMQL